MVGDSKNKRKVSPKSIEKELLLLSPHLGILWSETDDQSLLLRAKKALRQDPGQCSANFFFFKQRDPLLKWNLCETMVDKTEPEGAALVGVGTPSISLLPFLLSPSHLPGTLRFLRTQFENHCLYSTLFAHEETENRRSSMICPPV